MQHESQSHSGACYSLSAIWFPKLAFRTNPAGRRDVAIAGDARQDIIRGWLAPPLSSQKQCLSTALLPTKPTGFDPHAIQTMIAAGELSQAEADQALLDLIGITIDRTDMARFQDT
jgi:hypothetical protein